MDTIYLKIQKTAIKGHYNTVWKRGWEVYTKKYSQGTENLLEEITGDILRKDIIREFSNIAPYTVGQALTS